MEEDIILSEPVLASADDIDDLETSPVAAYAEYPDMPIYHSVYYTFKPYQLQFVHSFEMTQSIAEMVDHIEVSRVLASDDGEEVVVEQIDVAIDDVFTDMPTQPLVPGGVNFLGYSKSNSLATVAPIALAAAGFRTRIIGKDGEPMRFCLYSDPTKTGTYATSYMKSYMSSRLATESDKVTLRQMWALSKRYIAEELGLRQLKDVDLDGTDSQVSAYSHDMFDGEEPPEVGPGGKIDMGDGVSVKLFEVRPSLTYLMAHFRVFGWDRDTTPLVYALQPNGGTAENPKYTDAVFALDSTQVPDHPGEYDCWGSIGLFETERLGQRLRLSSHKNKSDRKLIAEKDIALVRPLLSSFCKSATRVNGVDGYPPEWVKAWCGANKEWDDYWEAKWAQN